jgi:hypothetical protein
MAKRTIAEYGLCMSYNFILLLRCGAVHFLCTVRVLLMIVGRICRALAWYRTLPVYTSHRLEIYALYKDYLPFTVHCMSAKSLRSWLSLRSYMIRYMTLIAIQPYDKTVSAEYQPTDPRRRWGH